MTSKKWKVLFYFGFAILPATKDKVVGGEILLWDTREEAERWARINCGPVCFEAVEVS